MTGWHQLYLASQAMFTQKHWSENETFCLHVTILEPKLDLCCFRSYGPMWTEQNQYCSVCNSCSVALCKCGLRYQQLNLPATLYSVFSRQSPNLCPQKGYQQNSVVIYTDDQTHLDEYTSHDISMDNPLLWKVCLFLERLKLTENISSFLSYQMLRSIPLVSSSARIVCCAMFTYMYN